MAAIPAAIAVLRNNRGVQRQNINREGCICFFMEENFYSDDIYTYINNKNNQKIFIFFKISDKNFSNLEFNPTRFVVGFRLRNMDYKNSKLFSNRNMNSTIAPVVRI